jgi:hypothetical protein
MVGCLPSLCDPPPSQLAAIAVTDQTQSPKHHVPLTVFIVAGVFCGFSLLHVAVPGVNEPHYLCKARATWDATWCARDFFLQSPAAHVIFFDVVGWFAVRWSLAEVACAGRVVSAILLAWGWTLLASSFGLRRSGTTAAAALLCLISLTGNFSGEWVLGGFESKVAAWGFGFAAAGSWIKTDQTQDSVWRWCITGIWLGLATTLHPVVGAWCVIAVTMGQGGLLLSPVRRAVISETVPAALLIRQWSVTVLTALLFALPGVVPALQVVMASDLSPWEQGMANRIQVFMRLKHHLDPSRFPPAAWVHSGFLLAVICGCSWRLSKTNQISVIRRHLLLLVSGLVIALVGVCIGAHRGEVAHLYHWSPRAFLLKFYPFRLIDVLMPVTASILVIVMLKEGLRLRPLRFFSRRCRILVAILIAGTLSAAYVTRKETPSGYSIEHFTAWKDACGWIQENTPPDSLFVTPREAVGFKWYAERAEVVCYKDCPQDAAGILEWRLRLRDLSWMRPVQLERPLKPSDLTWLREHFTATHLITRDHVVDGQTPVYENDVWRIYDLDS